MERPGAVLFDLDGVLIDSSETWFRLQDALAAALGCPAISRVRFRETFGQSVAEDARVFYGGAPAAEVEAYYETRFMDHADHLVAMAGAHEILARLAGAGVPSAVITNTMHKLACRVVARLELAPDLVIGTSPEVPAKPAPEMVRLAATRLGASAAEAVVVGDTRFDREAAAAAGARFVGFGIDGERRIERLEDLAPLVGL